MGNTKRYLKKNRRANDNKKTYFYDPQAPGNAFAL